MPVKQDIILQGDALIADIDACIVPPNQLALWWLGQHSFIVKAGATVIYIDPFLTPMEERLCPPLLKPSQIRHAAIICGTHDHADHIDRPVWPALAKASLRAKFVVPQLLLSRGLGGALGIAGDRFVGLDDGESVEIGGDAVLTPLPLSGGREGQGEGRITKSPRGTASQSGLAANPDRRPSPNPSLRGRGIKPQSAILSISAVAAAHEFLDRDPVTGRHPYLGYVIEANGCTLYHAGDTVWYEGLQTKLRRWKFDAMLVPINGRDANRLRNNIIGNMTYQEAADLCGPLSPGLVIPAHYDMFAGNPGDVEGFLDYMRTKYPNVPAMRCRYGQRVMIERTA